MLRCISIVVFVTVAPACLFQILAQEQELAVNIITKNGNHVKFPYFLPTLTKVDPQLKILLDKDIKEVVHALNGTLYERLVSKSSSPIKAGIAWGKLAAYLLLKGREQQKRRKNLAKSVGTQGTFNKEVLRMFKDMTQKSQIEAKKLEGSNKEPEKVAEDVSILFDDLVESMHHSPVGTYVDWAGGKINDEKFVDYGARLMGRLIQNGFNGAIYSIQKLLELISKL